MSIEQQLCNYFIGDIEAVQDRLKRMRLRKAEEKLIKSFKGYNFSNVTIDTMSSNCIYGQTHDGLSFSWYRNSGYNERSAFCGRLLVNDQCVFTSGSIAKAISHIAKSEISQ